MKILCPVSLGELADKASILEVKLRKIKDRNKLANIKRELGEIRSVRSSLPIGGALDSCIASLRKVNGDLFDVLARQRTTDPEEFLDCARQVILLNDKRFKLKDGLNRKYGSHIVEEKHYDEWTIPNSHRWKK